MYYFGSCSWSLNRSRLSRVSPFDSGTAIRLACNYYNFKIAEHELLRARNKIFNDLLSKEDGYKLSKELAN